MFKDRQDAGRRLAALLGRHRGPDTVVLGIPRGGVVVAAEVAKGLGAPLDVVVARKLGAPGQPELGFGAVSHGGVTVLNDGLVKALHLSRDEIDAIRAREAAEVESRTARFRAGRPPLDVRGKTAVLVDDGIATGYTVIAAARWLRSQAPRRIVLATPVVSPDTLEVLKREVDEVEAGWVAEWLPAVGAAYQAFDQVPDEEVVRVLGGGDAKAGPATSSPRRERPVLIPIGDRALSGDLVLPGAARGLVVFAHGSGSSRFSPRNRHVAEVLQQAGFGTLLMDLLTEDEERVDERTGHLRFDIGLLTDRLVAAIDATSSSEQEVAEDVKGLRIGLFGASTGAAAALRAAAERPERVGAVVSRGGRPDLAGDALDRVRAPALLIVGGDDEPVVGLNRLALERLDGESRLHVIPGATHLFPEPGALDEVALRAADWFARHLTR